jgi:6-pyruvoyltetrahydropterin/6-carboxytetrahydropterin synthase
MTQTYTVTRAGRYTATRLIEFDAAHRVPGHEGKCKHLHGHRYKMELTVAAAHGLDDLGRVVDFSVLKSVVGTWVDDHMDHNTLLYEGDRAMVAAIETAQPHKQLFLMNVIPTAENLAMFLFKQAQFLLAPYRIDVVNVRLWETPNCYADFNEGADVGQ